MPRRSCPASIDQTLRDVERRYRVPATLAAAVPAGMLPNAAAELAVVIEQARMALDAGRRPDEALASRFVDTLARVIGEAMRERGGDPAFQAMALRHRSPVVREYASLSAHAQRDRRDVLSMVDAVAHPGKLHADMPESRRALLARLHARASEAAWDEVGDIARQMIAPRSEASESDAARRRVLRRLLDDGALARLQRREALAASERVIHYRTLSERQGPLAGSAEAAARGGVTQRRGAAAEAQVQAAIETLARRLGERERASASYRVVTSMHVPPSIAASRTRAKSEWDVVLLRRPAKAALEDCWQVCLLIEVKSSVDAATNDFPRLLRGLRLLGHAEEGQAYRFPARQGEVSLCGDSLRALAADDAALRTFVLYCCDARAEPAPRLLGAASRMQLLSADRSLAYAACLAEGRPADAGLLAEVWEQLLVSPRWQGVLHQYPTLQRVRELMVDLDDLRAAIDDVTSDGRR